MGIKATWLGHGTFLLQTPEGKNILIDPWVENNPVCPDSLKKLDQVDLMLITHGHFDHIADAIPIAKQLTPQVVGIYELCHWLQRKGVENCVQMNKGGSVTLADVKITMVHADHSCGILEDDGSIVYGGEAVGYILTFSDGTKLYHAGDTNVFGDMALIQELYQPQIAMLPIGDQFTMSAREAAKACELLKPKVVVPMHFGTFPILTGTPDQLQELTKAMPLEVHGLKPGESLSL